MNKSRRLIASVIAAVVAVSLMAPAQAANAAPITAASAVRSVKASDAWLSTSPTTARAKISWSRPASTYGATITGYKIDVSPNKTIWKSLVANTKTASTSAVVSSGLSAGTASYFRVSAITKKGTSTKVGKPSSVASVTLSSAPHAPALLGLTKRTFAASTHVVRWVPQTPAQRGSSSTTYKVTAKSATGAEATCSASALNYCTLGALASGVSYTLSLTAKNARGSETNIDEFQAQDADISLQWYLGTDHGIAATRAWTATRGAKSVVVAVLDSGIIDHPELSGQLVDGYDFISDVKFDGDTIPGRDSDPTDIGSPEGDWHGTHVAGIIAAKSDGDGISGIAPLVKIQPIRVLSDKGGSVLDVMDAMKWAAGMSVPGVPDNTTPAKIINLSLTADMACYSQLQAVVDEIRSRGVVIVAAAGNGDANNVPRDNRLTSPTGCEGPISVGSSNFGGDITSYSNYNSDLLAPGGDLKFSVAGTNGTRGAIYSLWNPATPFSDGKVGYAGTIGTSMAAPMVSGTLALMVSLRPLATVRQLEEAILVSVQPFSPGTFCSTRNDRYCGFGTLNAATALEALIAITG